MVDLPGNLGSFLAADGTEEEFDPKTGTWGRKRPKAGDPWSWWFAFIFETDLDTFARKPGFPGAPVEIINLVQYFDLHEEAPNITNEKLPKNESGDLYLLPPLATEYKIQTPIKFSKKRIDGDFDPEKLGGTPEEVQAKQVLMALSMAAAAANNPAMAKGVTLEGDEHTQKLLYMAAQMYGLKVKNPPKLTEEEQAQLSQMFQAFGQQVGQQLAQKIQAENRPQNYDQNDLPAADSAKKGVNPAAAAAAGAAAGATASKLLDNDDEGGSNGDKDSLDGEEDPLAITDELKDYLKASYDKEQAEKIIDRLEKAEGFEKMMLVQQYKQALERDKKIKAAGLEENDLADVQKHLRSKFENEDLNINDDFIKNSLSEATKIKEPDDKQINTIKELLIEDRTIEPKEDGAETYTLSQASKDVGLMEQQGLLQGYTPTEQAEALLNEYIFRFSPEKPYIDTDEITQIYNTLGIESPSEKQIQAAEKLIEYRLRAAPDQTGKLRINLPPEQQAQSILSKVELPLQAPLAARSLLIQEYDPDTDNNILVTEEKIKAALQQAGLKDPSDEQVKASQRALQVLGLADKSFNLKINDMDKAQAFMKKANLEPKQLESLVEEIGNDFDESNNAYNVERLIDISKNASTDELSKEQAQYIVKAFEKDGSFKELENGDYELTEKSAIRIQMKLEEADVPFEAYLLVTQFMPSILQQSPNGVNAANMKEIMPEISTYLKEQNGEGISEFDTPTDEQAQAILDALVAQEVLAPANENGFHVLAQPKAEPEENAPKEQEEKKGPVITADSSPEELIATFDKPLGLMLQDVGYLTEEQKNISGVKQAVMVVIRDAAQDGRLEADDLPAFKGNPDLLALADDDELVEELIEKAGVTDEELEAALDLVNSHKGVNKDSDTITVPPIGMIHTKLHVTKELKDAALYAQQAIRMAQSVLRLKAGLADPSIHETRREFNFDHDDTISMTKYQFKLHENYSTIESQTEPGTQVDLTELEDNYMMLKSLEEFEYMFDKANAKELGTIAQKIGDHYLELIEMDADELAAKLQPESAEPPEEPQTDATEINVDLTALAESFDKPLGMMLQDVNYLTKEQAEISGQQQAIMVAVRNATQDGRLKTKELPSFKGSPDLLSIAGNDDLAKELIEKGNIEKEELDAALDLVNSHQGVNTEDDELTVPPIGMIHAKLHVSPELKDAALYAQQTVRMMDSVLRLKAGLSDQGVHETRREFNFDNSRDIEQIQAQMANHKAVSAFESKTETGTKIDFADESSPLSVEQIEAALEGMAVMFDEHADEPELAAQAQALVEEYKALLSMDADELAAKLQPEQTEAAPAEAEIETEAETEVDAADNDAEAEPADPEQAKLDEAFVILNEEYANAGGPLPQTALNLLWNDLDEDEQEDYLAQAEARIQARLAPEEPAAEEQASVSDLLDQNKGDVSTSHDDEAHDAEVVAEEDVTLTAEDFEEDEILDAALEILGADSFEDGPYPPSTLNILWNDLDGAEQASYKERAVQQLIEQELQVQADEQPSEDVVEVETIEDTSQNTDIEAETEAETQDVVTLTAEDFEEDEILDAAQQILGADSFEDEGPYPQSALNFMWDDLDEVEQADYKARAVEQLIAQAQQQEENLATEVELDDVEVEADTAAQTAADDKSPMAKSFEVAATGQRPDNIAKLTDHMLKELDEVGLTKENFWKAWHAVIESELDEDAKIDVQWIQEPENNGGLDDLDEKQAKRLLNVLNKQGNRQGQNLLSGKGKTGGRRLNTDVIRKIKQSI